MLSSDLLSARLLDPYPRGNSTPSEVQEDGLGRASRGEESRPQEGEEEQESQEEEGEGEGRIKPSQCLDRVHSASLGVRGLPLLRILATMMMTCP